MAAPNDQLHNHLNIYSGQTGSRQLYEPWQQQQQQQQQAGDYSHMPDGTQPASSSYAAQPAYTWNQTPYAAAHTPWPGSSTALPGQFLSVPEHNPAISSNHNHPSRISSNYAQQFAITHNASFSSQQHSSVQTASEKIFVSYAPTMAISTPATSHPPIDACRPNQMVSPDKVHLIIWAQAESYFRQAQRQYKDSVSAQAPSASWKASVIAGLSCLYSVVHLCQAQKSQLKYFGTNLVLGADTEARTRLRIALALAEWGECGAFQEEDGDESEEERQLKRALMAVPNAGSYIEIKYAAIAAHCKLLVRRNEQGWAEQRLKSALADAQQRKQYRWVQHFALELSNVLYSRGDCRSSLNVLQASAKQAQQSGDKLGSTVMAVQQLSRLLQMRDLAAAASLIGSVAPLMADAALADIPHVCTRFWLLSATAAAMRGAAAEAQEAAASARDALKRWQSCFARQIAEGRAADGGASFVLPSQLHVRGWSYYEAHAWVMLASALVLRGDGYYDRASGFLRLAMEGIARGEKDGLARQLSLLKILVLLHVVDTSLQALFISEARLALDRIMHIVAEHKRDSSMDGPWQRTRDAIALRWAMYRHRTGEFAEAIEAYRCVARQGPDNLKYAALANIAVLYLTKTPELTKQEADELQQTIKAMEASMAGKDHETVRRALLEFVQGMGTVEPVKAKTHLLSCLRLCTEATETALQGWTLCLLGTMVLSTGQYEQAMKMCAAGQAIAQGANDPLQNAAAIGILTQIEKAVGDPDRHEKLLQVDRQLLQRFNSQITDT
ncbi:hypothetical protein IWW36_000633 [Coemansia brasiliensis]|uniref:Cohesin loading factor n=1 Tax=Coemansia brasiliensis TaxID=2650707 RepID=A0A9W8M2S9_9FUNG|nr:hypothetical protein IWW36_000633 [Coemansia brasiliensis]